MKGPIDEVLVLGGILGILMAAVHLCEESVDGVPLVVVCQLLCQRGILPNVRINQVVLV